MRRKNVIIYSIMAVCVIAFSGCGRKMDRQTGMEFSQEAVEGVEGVRDAAVAGGVEGTRDAVAAGGGEGTRDAATSGGREGIQGVATAGGREGTQDAEAAGGREGTQDIVAAGRQEGTRDAAAAREAEEGAGTPADGETADLEGQNGRVGGTAGGQPGDGEKAPGLPEALKVTGTQLTDSQGTPIQLKGISTHGLVWYPEYVNEECFRQFREEWGMDVVRLAMYTGEYGGYCTGGNQDELKELIKKGVSYATDCGMYVIIDWHILSDGNPNTYLEEAKEFFGEMADEYADYSNVIYEICNEPNGGISWSDIKKYAEQVIEVIRKKDEDGIILVGTPNWCQYVEQAAADPITDYDNIMYTLHFYAATHTDSLRDAMVRAVEAGLPVFVSEYGICDASGNGAVDTVQADRWAELLDEYGISYVAWNLSNKAETSAVLKSSCGKVSGFTSEDLSDSGKWLYERLGADGKDAAGERNGGNAFVNHSGGTAGNGAEDREGGSASGGNSGNGRNGQGEAGAAGNDSGESKEGAATGNDGSGANGSGTAGDGSAGSASADLDVTAKLVNSWGQGGETCFQYELTVSNPGDTEQNGWTVRLHFSHDISLQDSWNGIYTVEGKELAISSMDYNGVVPADGSVGGIGFIIKADGECCFEE